MPTLGLESGSLAYQLREFRTAQNLSQLALSASSGVNVNTIWRIENEASLASVTTLVSLAMALEVSTDRLLGIDWLGGTSSQVDDRSPSRKLAALQRLTAHYTTVYNTAEALIYAMDLDGILVEFNRSFQDLMGYERQSLIGTPGTDLLAKVSLSLSHTMREKKMQGVVETVYPITFVTKKNGDSSVNVRTQLIFESGVPIGIQGIGHLVV